MASPPRLVLHADDLGMNRAVTAGVLAGFRDGLLTSTSVLANAPAVVEALRHWKDLVAEHAAGRLPSAANRKRLDDPSGPFDLGVHLNLTQGQPLSAGFPAELLDAEGRFPGIFPLFARLARSGKRFRAAILLELAAQVAMVCDHGLRPTHLNGHQYIEMLPAVSKLMPELLGRFGIHVVRVAWEAGLWRSTVLRGRFWLWPLAAVKHRFARRFRTRMDSLGIRHPAVFFGTAHAGRIDLGLLEQFLTAAGASPLVEVALHPGGPSKGTTPDEQAAGWHDPLAACRRNELRLLRSAELAAHLESAGWRLGRLAS
jgi:predicted glycoside hydrolase/deacetylase ChbG (UPF0249 family)